MFLSEESNNQKLRPFVYPSPKQYYKFLIYGYKKVKAYPAAVGATTTFVILVWEIRSHKMRFLTSVKNV